MGHGQGAIDPYGDGDYWSFEAVEGDIVSISVDTPGSDLYPYVCLYNSAGSRIRCDYEGGPEHDAYIGHYAVTTSGTYFVSVSCGGGASDGSYHLRLELARGLHLETDVNNGNDLISGANSLSLQGVGSSSQARVAGTIIGASDEDVFDCGAINTGNIVELSLSLPTSSTLEAKLTLRDSDNVAVADEDGNPDDAHFLGTIAADGIYYAMVDSNAGAGVLAQYILNVELTDLIPPMIISATDLPDHGTTTDQIVDSFTLRVSENLDPSTVTEVEPIGGYYEGHYYFMTSEAMTWAEAEAYAQTLGGHLVTINDEADQDWLFHTFYNRNAYWIGLTDEAVEGTWVWASGQEVTYTNWAPGEPYHASYDYAYLNKTYDKWYACPGTSNLRGLIELESAADTDGDGIPDFLDSAPADSSAPVNPLDLREAGDDGLFDTADDLIYRLRYSASGTTISITESIDGPLGTGHYRLTVYPTVTDVQTVSQTP